MAEPLRAHAGWSPQDVPAVRAATLRTAYAVAAEQVDVWKACGLTTEEMFAAITGTNAHCVSEGVVIAVIAAAWIDMQRAKPEIEVAA